MLSKKETLNTKITKSQLGGVFVMKDRDLFFQYHEQFSGDHPKPFDILQALDDAKEAIEEASFIPTASTSNSVSKSKAKSKSKSKSKSSDLKKSPSTNSDS